MSCRLWLACVAALFLGGCASQMKPPVYWNPGLKLVGTPVDTITPPKLGAMKAVCQAALRHNGRRMRFQAVIVADSLSGRLEALGPLGLQLATVLWTDTSWQLWLPGQNTLVRGEGDSISIPTLGLRGVRPAELASILLGRHLASNDPNTMVRIHKWIGQQKSTVVPAIPNPTWSVVFDRHSGLPVRRQILENGREVSAFHYSHWQNRLGVAIPDSIVQTTPSGQELSLHVKEWTLLRELPSNLLDLEFSEPVDTIVVNRTPEGRPLFQIRPAVGLEEMVPDPGSEDDTTGMEDSLEIQDSLDLADTTEVEEDSVDQLDSADSMDLEDTQDASSALVPAVLGKPAPIAPISPLPALPDAPSAEANPLVAPKEQEPENTPALPENHLRF